MMRPLIETAVLSAAVLALTGALAWLVNLDPSVFFDGAGVCATVAIGARVLVPSRRSTFTGADIRAIDRKHPTTAGDIVRRNGSGVRRG